MKNSIQVEYQNKTIVFSMSGWLNASHVAELYSASIDSWLRSYETKEYLTDVATVLGVEGPQELIQISAESIWLHPKVAVEFARDIDRKLARWCDIAIDKIAHGKFSMKKRFDAACKVLEESRCEASEHGRGLRKWSLEKRGLEYHVAHLKEQMQLSLGLDNPS